jgi:hypothetical protein
MPVIRTDEPATETSPLPECLTLWRCIGCGSMGNAAECLGTCQFRKLEVVGAQEHADLLEGLAAIADHMEDLTAMAREIAALAEDQCDFERVYRQLQTRAREILKLAVAEEWLRLESAEAESDRATVWFCACCGQVEAPEPCLGVCIRRNGEFVRGDEHDRRAAEFAAALKTARALTALARQLVWVAPRAGQWERTCRAFGLQAIKLLQTSPRSLGAANERASIPP